MNTPPEIIVTLHTALTESRAEAAVAMAELAVAKAKASAAEAENLALRLEIARLRRDLYGQRSERATRLFDQLELQLEEAEASAGEDELAAERAVAKATNVAGFSRAKPSRKPFPAHLPRERVVVPGPTTCPCCGSEKLCKLGETVTESLESVPRQWKVIQTVREKFSCRQCETISQPPAPFHAIPRGLFGPSLLAMILFEKFGQHQPLNRQCERFAREGVEISRSTAADMSAGRKAKRSASEGDGALRVPEVGAAAGALKPLHERLEAHVFAAERLHGDDTTVPVLAKGKTDTGRIRVYVRDDKPFGGEALPAALFYYSRDRAGEHPEAHLKDFAGLLQADAYAGYNALYRPDRKPGPILGAFCWSHARRKFFVLADIAASIKRGPGAPPISPMAPEAVKRIDAIFDIERAINGKSREERLAMRREITAPLVAELKAWLQAERARLSRHAPVAKAIDYMLKRWDGFVRFLDDGRICLTNNAAERALRGIALGRKSWLFAGSDRGGQRAAFMYSLIVTAKMNDIDPQAWLADVLTRIADLPQSRLPELLPWNWKALAEHKKAA